MHSLIDIIGGLAFGLGILAVWLSVSDYIDDFVVSGQNGKNSDSHMHNIHQHQLFDEISTKHLFFLWKQLLKK